MSKPDHTNTFVPIMKPVAGRVDVLFERIADLLLKRSIERHPLHAKLKDEVGLDVSSLLKNSLADTLKREKIKDLRSLRRALRK